MANSIGIANIIQLVGDQLTLANRFSAKSSRLLAVLSQPHGAASGCALSDRHRATAARRARRAGRDRKRGGRILPCPRVQLGAEVAAP
jgi:hypothetical protein